MNCCHDIPQVRQGGACPCGCGTRPICNMAQAAGRCFCAGQSSGVITAESEPVCIDVVELAMAKTVQPTVVQRGGRVTYTIALQNRSTLPISSVVVTDPALAEWFEIGTVRVNGAAVAGNPAEGIPVPNIGTGGAAVITIEAAVLDTTPTVINNTAYARFDMVTACDGRESMQASSNQVELLVAEPELQVEKRADRCYVTPQDPVLTYTITVTNAGNCQVNDVVIRDVMPERLEYVEGSTRINGDAPVNLDPADGINVGDLEPGEEAEIVFEAQLSD